MKRTILKLFFLGFSVVTAFLPSQTLCQEPIKVYLEFPSVSGDESTATLSINSIGSFEERIISSTLESGVFIFEFPSQKEVSLAGLSIDGVKFNRNYASEFTLFLKPGDSIRVVAPNTNTLRYADLKFYGTRSKEQEFRKMIGIEYEAVLGYDRGMRSYEEATSKYIALFERLQLLFNKENQIDPLIHKAMKAEILSNHALGAALYVLYNSMNVTEEVRKSFYLNNKSGLFNVDEYAVDIEGFLQCGRAIMPVALLNFAVENDLLGNTSQILENNTPKEVLKSLDHDDTYDDWIIAFDLILKLKIDGPTASLSKQVNDFVSDGSSSYPREYVSNLLEIFKSNLRRGTDAYQFELQNVNGQTQQLSDFKGQVVLIDFMYNGCFGCASITPTLEELEKSYQGQDVAFVSISIDKHLNSFKKGIGKFCSKNSVPLWTGGQAASHPIIKYYGIGSYPTLVLIDKNGKLISGRAPNPRTKEGKDELIALIEDAL